MSCMPRTTSLNEEQSPEELQAEVVRRRRRNCVCLNEEQSPEELQVLRTADDDAADFLPQ